MRRKLSIAIAIFLLIPLIASNQLLLANDTNADKALIKAVKTGDLKVVKKALKKSEVNCQPYKDGLTPLMRSIYFKHPEIFEFLLKKKADIHLQTQKGWTALFFAANTNQIEMIKRLIAEGSDVNRKNNSGSTPLFWAVRKGHESAVQFLIDNGADVNAHTDEGSTPLTWAVDEDNTKVAEMLIRNGAEVNVQTNAGFSPLIKASKRGNVEMADLLLENKANLHLKTKKHSYTAILMAASCQKTDVVKSLLKNGANVEDKTGKGTTPLMWAAVNGDVELAGFLIKNGADVNTPDNSGETPLGHAARKNHEKMISFLIDQGADINSKNEKGTTPLLWASAKGNLQSVTNLLDNKADINGSLNTGWTPLTIAINLKKTKIAQFLIERGADLNVRTQKGDTALSLAIKRGQTQVLESLLTKGVNTNIKSPKGLPIYQYAYQKDKKAFRILLKSAAKGDMTQDSSFNPLLDCVKAGDYETVQLLLAKGFNPKIKDPNNRSAMDLAIQKRSYSMIGVLEKHGFKRPKAGPGSAMDELTTLCKGYAARRKEWKQDTLRSGYMNASGGTNAQRFMRGSRYRAALRTRTLSNWSFLGNQTLKKYILTSDQAGLKRLFGFAKRDAENMAAEKHISNDKLIAFYYASFRYAEAFRGMLLKNRKLPREVRDILK